MIGKRQFEILARGGGKEGKGKTFVSNIARGPIIDTAAFIEALEQGQISGAAIDVTDPEPLPAGHALWKAPNLFMTPHISWQSKNVMVRVAEILFSNLERLEAGEPMINEVRRE